MAETSSFVAQAVAEGQATLLGEAAVNEPLTPNAALTTKRSMRFGSSTRESPGVSFCVSLKKEWSATNDNDQGVAALLARVEGRSSTEGRRLMLPFIALIRGSLLRSA